MDFKFPKNNLIQNKGEFTMLLMNPKNQMQAIMISDEDKFNQTFMIMNDTDFNISFNIFMNSLQNGYNNTLEIINENTDGTLSAQRLQKLINGYGLAIYTFNTTKNKWVRP